jgi:outer membrane protein insertion porin family
MQCRRLVRLSTVLVCLFGPFTIAGAPQQQPAPPKPAPSKPPNPFETVPTTPVDPKPQAPKEAPQQAKPQLEAPKPPAEPKPEDVKPGQISDTIELIEFRGARRVPQDTLRALIYTKKGDPYNQETLNRDFMALWNTSRFDDIRMEREPGRTGWIVRFVVQERRVVRSIKYDGMKSITVSEILDRFKERKVGLQVETQYDPNRVQRAANVLKEYLAERGRQFATVDPELRQVPPSSLEVNFKVNEGPKVKVGEIDIQGNQVFNDRAVIRAMKNLHPIGIPYSIFLENLFSKTFDSTKLEEDKDRIRNFYQERGYFTARALEHKVEIIDVGGGKFKIPLFYPNKPGKRANISVEVEEGKLYRLGKVNFQGVKFFRTPDALFRPVFGMGEGDVFSTAKLRKGMEQLGKLYGEFGFLDVVPEPDFTPNRDTGILDMTLTVDEGKQFFVRRIDFSGNTTTRDKVIRRELLVDEGDLFNTRLWEVSLLRLNQLGYFEVLKEKEAANITRDTRNSTVDITLRVKERGKNSVQLSGGVSGIAGSFIAFGYSTNNFLGLGETLSIDTQLGDRIRSATFGFTEPYFLDKPIQAGFTVFYQRFNYDQGREVSLFSGRNLIPLYNQLGSQNLLNYVSNGAGFSLFATTLLKRSFARVGISYNFNQSNITPLSQGAENYFTYFNFQGLAGPNQLNGIRTTSITPNYSYNTVDHPITPSRGRSLYISSMFAGSFLGGNVNMIEPSIDAKYFRSGFKKGHVIGMHFLGRFVTGYGGKSAPPFNRFFMGGENDIRGFQIWGISPMGFIPTQAQVAVRNADNSIRLQKIIDGNGQEVMSPVMQTIPSYQITLLGGDTQGVYNIEYRIPIFGPVTLAAFADVGVNMILMKNQLRLNQERLDTLNFQFPQANFGQGVQLASATSKPRMSTGLELQIMMPVVNAPFRLYWAYNPLRVHEFLQPPVVADRSYFPNSQTFDAAVLQYGRPIPYFEQLKTFRFTISRTF